MKLPSSLDLRPQINFVEDQGTIGTCNPFAKNKALQILYERDGVTLNFSELYLYWYARQLGNTLGQEGSSPYLANVVLQSKGCCLEASWPYDITKREIKPPESLDAEAALYKIKSSVAMNWFDQDPIIWVKTHLAEGKPVTMMFHITGDFKTAAGAVRDWRQTDWTLSDVSQGDHEVVIIGYDDTRFLIQNSWGPDWGDGGFFGMPYTKFMNSRVASLVDVITAYQGKLHQVPESYNTPPQTVIDKWYWPNFRRDVTDPNDPNVIYWANHPEGEKKFLEIYLENVVARVRQRQAELNAITPG